MDRASKNGQLKFGSPFGALRDPWARTLATFLRGSLKEWCTLRRIRSDNSSDLRRYYTATKAPDKTTRRRGGMVVPLARRSVAEIFDRVSVE